MGRFTLRDEGKTIAVGKVLKYKPVKIQAYVTPSTATTNAGSANLGSDNAGQVVVNGTAVSAKLETSATTDKKQTEELVYDLDTGEMVTREEYNKRN